MAKRPPPTVFSAHSLIFQPDHQIGSDQVYITDLTVDSEW